jgi:hypothetical protein
MLVRLERLVWVWCVCLPSSSVPSAPVPLLMGLLLGTRSRWGGDATPAAAAAERGLPVSSVGIGSGGAVLGLGGEFWALMEAMPPGRRREMLARGTRPSGEPSISDLR